MTVLKTGQDVIQNPIVWCQWFEGTGKPHKSEFAPDMLEEAKDPAPFATDRVAALESEVKDLRERLAKVESTAVRGVTVGGLDLDS
jgi:hypothetical protein